MTTEFTKGWARTPLGSVCLPVGKTDPRTSPDLEFEYIDIGGISPGSGHIQATRSLKGSEAPSRARQVVHAGDIVLSTVRTYQRKTAIVPTKLHGAVASTGFSVLRPVPGVDSRFLLFQLLSHEFVSQLNSQQTGTSYPAVRDRDVRAMSILIAPTAEQERIVASIEEHFSCLDTTDDGVSAAAAKTDALSSTAISQLFLKEWPTRRIGELARVGSGATPNRSEARYWSHGTIPWVTSGAVNERAIVSPTELITEDALAETGVRLWPAGTVLVAMYGEGKTRGKAAVLGFESTCNQACAAIDHDRSLLNGSYLLAYLNAQYHATRRLGFGGVQPNLSLGLMKSMEIRVPSLKTQESVALQAEDIAQKSSHLLDTCTGARRHAAALRHSILGAAFSGQLVRQNPYDEPASVLLERIATSRMAMPKRQKATA